MAVNKENEARVQAERARYMDGEITFQAYYEWLADYIGATFAMVPFPLERIKASKDEHLNDLPLRAWDRQDSAVRTLAYRKGLSWSLNDTVCVLKTLARKEARNNE